MTRKLIKGAHVMTMDKNYGYMDHADILIVDTKIEEIALNIRADDADIIDGTNMLAMPGFIDSHRHTWQSLLRASAVDWTIDQYLMGVRGIMGGHYSAEDIYVANWLGALDCLDAGITTLLDWSHNNNSPAHADGAIQGLKDAGIRAVFAYGDSNEGWVPVSALPMNYADVRRVRKQYFSSDDQLITMAIASRGPQFSELNLTVEELHLARELELFVTMHVGDGSWGKGYAVKKLHDIGLLDDKFTFVHCNTLHDEEFKIIGEIGASAVISPEVELNMGHGFPATLKLMANGVRPGISADVCTSSTGDMFSQMRAILSGTRSVVNNIALEKDESVSLLPLTAKDVIGFATIDGAGCCKLAHKTGSLTPGKEADIILIDTLSPNMIPFNNPIGILAEGAHVGNITTVLVAGKVVKKDGKLVGVDYGTLKSKAEATRDRLYAIAGANPADWFPKRIID